MRLRVLGGFAVVALAVAAYAAKPADSHAAVSLCTTEAAAVDRPDAATGHQIHVVYAIPADGEDHFASIGPAIARDLAAADAWWRGQDSTRTPRFDVAGFAGCGAGVGDALDITVARLPEAGAAYAAADGRLQRVRDALVAAPFGLAQQAKKYLVLYDGPVAEPNPYCGVAFSSPDRGGAAGYMLVVLTPPGCRSRIGESMRAAGTIAHEIAHSLGALAPVGPPHACPGDPSHPCDSSSDILSTSLRDDRLDRLVLDVGRDDYYAHPGSWWDVQDSPWLRRLDVPTHALEVRVEGPGSIAVDLPGLGTCTTTCVGQWQAGTTLTFTFAPTAGARVSTIDGPCTGSGCRVTIDGPKFIRVKFATPVDFTVVKRGRGRGLVVSSPVKIHCGEFCTAPFDPGQQLHLTARPGKGFRFVRWGGACAGREPECVVDIQSPTTVEAWFEPLPKPKTKTKTKKRAR